MCPVVKFMKRQPDIDVRVCVTAQHRELLDQVLSIFEVTPDHDLGSMRPGQTLAQSMARMMSDLERVLQVEKPDMVLVQGDTTTTFCGALASFYANVPVGHIEAGLRTGNMRQPFPEEMNRVLVGKLAAIHFASTEGARDNLKAEGILPETITVTGNSGIDAVLDVRDRLVNGSLTASCNWSFLNPHKKLIFATAHRRESFGPGLERICMALNELAGRDDIEIVYPLHPNPQVTQPVRRQLAGRANIHLMEPLDYVSCVDLMRLSAVLLTDSGGIQEEGPSLGKPVFVLREVTERPEAVTAGTATLVGQDTRKIVDSVTALLADPAEYQRRSMIHNPFGDGHASERITATIRNSWKVA